MEKWKVLESEWDACYARLSNTEFFRLLSQGELRTEHYKGFLRESFYNVGQNPRLMALFASRLSGADPDLIAKFLKHTAMEMGHDELALADLDAMGEDTAAVRRGRPLPTTESLAAFIYFHLMQGNPATYLGYSFHLESLPVRFGAAGIATLSRMGIPPNATSFLMEHAEADQIHMKWNREYVEGFIRSAQDLDAAVHGVRGACELHGIMFQGIVDRCRSLGSERKAA